MSDTITEPVDLHDKKDAPVPTATEGANVKGPEENPGDGKLHVEKGKEADALPTAPVYNLNPQGQRVLELRNRLRSAVNACDQEVLNGEPETQYHRNQILGLRKNVLDLLAEGYGEISFDSGVLSINVPLDDDAKDEVVEDKPVDEDAPTI